MCRESAEELHKLARCEEEEQKACNETVDTCCLRKSDTKDHCTCNITLALWLTADNFASTGCTVTFTDTRADTCDKSKTGADAATCKSDTLS